MTGRLSIIAAVAAMALSGCAATVVIPPPQPSATEVAQVCQEVTRQLPSAVMNLVRRSVEPNPDLTAAWGNPPVTLRCGVPEPKTLTPTSKLIAVDNVDWLPEKRSNGYVFTTIGRVANVEVSVPQDYEPETQALIELSGAVKSADPLAPA